MPKIQATVSTNSCTTSEIQISAEAVRGFGDDAASHMRVAFATADGCVSIRMDKDGYLALIHDVLASASALGWIETVGQAELRTKIEKRKCDGGCCHDEV